MRRAAFALAFGVLAQVAIIGATLYRLPWRLFGPPGVKGFAVVSRRGELYWSVDVTRFGHLETLVSAEPAMTFEAAQKRVESSYEAVVLLKESDFRTRLMQGGGVGGEAPDHEMLLPERLPGWFSLAGHNPSPFRVVYRPEYFVYRIDIRAVGWPARCLWGEEVWAAVLPDYREERGRDAKAQQVRWSRGMLSFSEEAFPLPLLPIWRGLGIDVLAFALPLLGMQIAMASWRAGRRRRRGQCVVCNYDRSGIGAAVACPECGDTPRVRRSKLAVGTSDA